MVIKPKRGQKILLNSSQPIYELMSGLIDMLEPFDRDKEHFWVIGLSRALYVRYLDWVTMGTMHATFVEAREVFRNAILHGASSIVLVHNHPSGQVEPSKQDRETTGVLVKARNILKIRVVDHVIIGEWEYYSFADEGILDS